MKIAGAIGFKRGQAIILGQFERVAIAPGKECDGAQDRAVGKREVGAMQRVERDGGIADCQDVANEGFAAAAGTNGDR